MTMHGATVVGDVQPIDLSGVVYSLEVNDTATFATNGGIVVHNCIPLDPFYLAWKARESGQPTRFIELAGEINTQMPALRGRQAHPGTQRAGQVGQGRPRSSSSASPTSPTSTTPAKAPPSRSSTSSSSAAPKSATTTRTSRSHQECARGRNFPRWCHCP